MFDEATILARLQNGEDAQTIANEMAAALNKVNKMHQDTLAKQAAEKAAAERAEVQKKEELQDMKFKALSTSSRLTEQSRQSKVLQKLKENKDSVLHIATQPPFIINVPEENTTTAE